MGNVIALLLLLPLRRKIQSQDPVPKLLLTGAENKA